MRNSVIQSLTNHERIIGIKFVRNQREQFWINVSVFPVAYLLVNCINSDNKGASFDAEVAGSATAEHPQWS